MIYNYFYCISAWILVDWQKLVSDLWTPIDCASRWLRRR